MIMDFSVLDSDEGTKETRFLVYHTIGVKSVRNRRQSVRNSLKTGRRR
jgi:hypothetical protein